MIIDHVSPCLSTMTLLQYQYQRGDYFVIFDFVAQSQHLSASEKISKSRDIYHHAS